jgi:hypothetical protein
MIDKPKLLFFRVREDSNLSEFISLHRQQHVQCLSEFFEVLVINHDCDYQQLCDVYQPDLALFESGVNYRSCHRIKIENTNSHPNIPKLGLHNGDSWCEARAGFISDMENWGIETFFSIAATMAEHTPEIANHLFVWPNFIDSDTYHDYGQAKTIPVLFTGSQFSLYPWRQRIYKIVTQHYPSLTCPHLGYQGHSEWKMLHGERYARTINASWFAPTCGSVEKEIIRKHFEIPASKACLITERSAVLEAAGFVDMENCVFADEDTVLDKIDDLFNNIDKLESLIDKGYKLVQENHALTNRDQILQWFNLYKKLEKNQRIVQTNPFGRLTIISTEVNSEAIQITPDGLVLSLLTQGDTQLLKGDYKGAEALFLQCLKYIDWMSEPKLKLALCSLYQGNSKAALDWITQPIKYTLETYKALDPDPVEWAYYIVALLCQGCLKEAKVLAEQFPSLHHVELDRVRLVVNTLSNNGENTLNTRSVKQRYSVHRLPERSFDRWVEEICTMLESSRQYQFSASLKQAFGPDQQASIQTQQDLFKISFLHLLKFRSKSIKPSFIYKSNFQPKSNSNTLYNRIKRKAIGTIEQFIIKPLNKLEQNYRFFLPLNISIIRQDELFLQTQSLLQQELKTIALLGASSGEIVTEALVAAMLQQAKAFNIFLIDDKLLKSSDLKMRLAKFSSLKLIELSLDRSIEEQRTEGPIENDHASATPNNFDLVILDASELNINLKIDKFYGAKFILLDDINTFQNHENYQKLASHPSYVLFSHNYSLRKGYAIFRKAR